MTTPNTTVLAEVSKILKDEINFVFDLQTELLPLLNRAVPEIVWADPYSNTIIFPYQCTDGVTQALPPDAVALVEVQRNLGTTASLFGGVITKVDRDHLNAARPGWPMDVMGSPGVPSQPCHSISSERGPKFFDLWPQPNGTWWIQLMYSQVPDDVGLDDNFPLPDMYIMPAESWIISRALAGRRAELNEQTWKLVEFHAAAFDKAMGTSTAATLTNVPNNTVNRP